VQKVLGPSSTDLTQQLGQTQHLTREHPAADEDGVELADGPSDVSRRDFTQVHGEDAQSDTCGNNNKTQTCDESLNMTPSPSPPSGTTQPSSMRREWEVPAESFSLCWTFNLKMFEVLPTRY